MTARTTPRPSVRILSVDDDASMRRLISRSLHEEGYDIESCASIDEALKALRAERFSAAILDVMMVNENGFDLARRIRAGEGGESNRGLPIVFVTAQSDAESYEQSFDVGAYTYITKPFQPEALVEALSAMLHGG
jgi:DNA-binding response OmpR family regulator